MSVELVKVVAIACLITSCVSTPTAGIVPQPESEQDSPKYEYSYVVKDDYGGTQGHVETREGEYATGKYYVHVPGRIDQKVDYFADDWGYHPLVEYKSLSRSGSSSTQFALGEKAVAALTKSAARFGPDKLLRARSSSPRPKPSVSIHSSSGIISNPTSEEQQLEGTSTIPTPTPLLSFQSTSGVVSNPTELHEDSENNVQTSTVEPVKITASKRYRNRHAHKTQPSSSTETVSLTTKAEVDTGTTEDISFVNFESKKHVPYTEFTKSVSENENYFKNLVSSVTTDSSKIDAVSTEEFVTEAKNETLPLNSSAVNEDSIEITSYLADSNSAVDVHTKNVSDAPEYTEDRPTSAHTISAILFAESDQKQEDNEIQSESSRVSSTAAPEKSESNFPFGPIIVPDYPRIEDVAEFFLNSSKAEEKQELSSFNEEHEGISVTGEDNELRTTPRPLRKTLSKSDSELSHNNEGTPLGASSNELLAPIHAGVTLSSNIDPNGNQVTVSKVITEDEYPTHDDELKIEKQLIQKEGVYKTTVDIQKSIPFEISTQKLNINQQLTSHGNQADHKDPEQQTPVRIQFSDLSQNVHQNLDLKIVPLIQQGTPTQNVHINPLQSIPQTTYVPGNLYYIYLQRYNPYINKYGIVPQPVILQPYPFSANAVNNPLYQSLPQLQPETYSRVPDGSKLNILDTEIHHPVPPAVAQNIDSLHDQHKNVDTIPLGDFQKSIDNSQTSFSQTKGKENPNLPTKLVESLDTTSDIYHNPTESETLHDENGVRSAQLLASTYAAQLNALTAAKYNEIHSSDSQISEIKVDTTINSNQEVQDENVNTDSGEEGEYLKESSEFESNLGRNIEFNNGELNGVQHEMEISKTISGENVVPTEPLPSEEPIASKHKPFQGPIYVGIEPNQPRAQPFVPSVADPVSPAKTDSYRHLLPPLLSAVIPHAMKHPKQLSLQPHPTHIATITIKHHHPHSAKARRGHQLPAEKSHQAPFIPSQKVFSSVYPPETYYVTQYMTRQDRSGGKTSRQLIIEYGGFKPPLIPSVQIDIQPTASTVDESIKSKLR